MQRDRNLVVSFLFFLSFFLFSFPTGSVHAFFARVLFIKIHQDPLIFISSRTRNTTSYLVNLHYRTRAVIHIQRSREQNILQQLRWQGRSLLLRKYTRADVVKYPRVKYRCKIRSFMQNVK